MESPQETARDGVIRSLPQTVVNQIAAGEVIERPASVVKELVENAIDAGATRIKIDLEEGGVRLVRVVDDGCGMGTGDLELVFAPHATSKLHTPDDLDHIASLGFRGEAMASIGSIARCRVVSRQGDDGLAHTVEDTGGEIGDVVEAGGALGTTVEVRDLFFNTPARRRFLKRTSTELSRCLDVIQRIALAHEGIGFVVTHDSRRLFDVEPSMDLLARIRRTFGAELADSLVPVEFDEHPDRPGFGLRLTGFVAPPRFSRRDTSRLMWFLNGRFLRDKLLHRVVKEGYRGFLVENRQPVAFLRLAMDPALVDVNVHPTKAEVRFREGRRMFGMLVRALRDAVAQTDIATPGASLVDSMLKRELGPGRSELQPGQTWLPAGGSDHGVIRPAGSGWLGSEPSRPGTGGATGSTDSGSAGWSPAGTGGDREGFRGAQGTSSYPSEVDGQATAATPSAEGDIEAWATTDELRGPYLQVDKTYLLREVPGGFEVIDQHALHERLTYELLLRDLRAGSIEVQGLLVPELVELAKSEVELIGEHCEAIKTLGVDLAVFGPATIAVHGLPARIKRPNVEGMVTDLVHTIEAEGKPPNAEDVVEEVLHRMACRSSIMAGDSLTQEEIHALLSRARELGCDQTCPHARPTRVRFNLADLERAFHRR
ncbi:MAG: DNA mismatch repair endonuclease MutL [Planctomycetota bacterium]|nr:DNA mismatch repair endonuclease MutL [Planctomycetota bacterium]